MVMGAEGEKISILSHALYTLSTRSRDLRALNPASTPPPDIPTDHFPHSLRTVRQLVLRLMYG